MDTVKVSVLGYVEDGHWVAHALEMDVIGVGNDWEGALAELRENICAQVSFARYRGDDSLIFQPAPPRLFKQFRQAREAELRDLVSRTQRKSLCRFRSDDLDIPKNIPEGRYASA